MPCVVNLLGSTLGWLMRILTSSKFLWTTASCKGVYWSIVSILGSVNFINKNDMISMF